MMTTDSVLTENIYKLKREPLEAARMIDKLDLTSSTRGASAAAKRRNPRLNRVKG